MDVMCQNIPGFVKEYFAMSHNILWRGKIFAHVT
jgi:hypothetical protein